MTLINKQQFFIGAKAGIPVMIGFFPIATAFSMIALQSGLTSLETNAMSIFLLAGASQIMAVSMLSLGAGVIEIILATFIINLRHFIMSTYVMNKLNNTSLLIKLLLAFGVTDETFGIISSKGKENCNPYYFGGLALVTYSSWIIGTLIGTTLGHILPSQLCTNMSIALYAMFIALLIPDVVKNYKVGFVALTSMLINYVLSMVISPSWSIILATILGAFIGTFILKENDYEYQNDTNNSGNESSDIYS